MPIDEVDESEDRDEQEPFHDSRDDEAEDSQDQDQAEKESHHNTKAKTLQGRADPRGDSGSEIGEFLPASSMFGFVTGVAGSGKTFFMKNQAENDRRRSHVLAATTGIAA